MIRKYILHLAAFIISASVHGQALYFNGLGRVVVTNDALDGQILNNDKTTPRRGTGGYTVFDLGVNVQPADYLRAAATLRVRNEFGGFYGDGAEISFRQIKLDGIIAKKVSYELGDLDLSLTPYTLFNFYESYYTHEAQIFSIRRSIVNYENFFFGNKWRLQGANASTNLKFTKGIERIGFRAFATRSRRAISFGNNVPDRYLYGGRIDVLQSRFFQVGINHIAKSDLQGTVPSALYNFDNQVTTGDAKVNLDFNKIAVNLYGEAGASDFKYTSADSTRSKQDYFYDGGISAAYKPFNLKVFVNYRNVGSAFNSPGAQTRRIFDNGIPSLFSGYQRPVSDTSSRSEFRTPVLLDRYSDESPRDDVGSTNVRNTTIQDVLLDFNPRYNNITPYGIATPNRQGLTLGASVGDIEKFIFADINLDLLSEIREEVNNGLRKFTGIKGGLNLNIHRAVGFEKLLIVTGGIRNEHTERTGAQNRIDLTTNLLDAGVVVEVFKNFDLLGGYKVLVAEGNEYQARRDVFNEVVTDNITVLNFNSTEAATAAGLRYRFSKNSFATVQWHSMSYSDTRLRDEITHTPTYKINQIFMNYTLIF